MAALVYASRGLVGVLTPQANTTVEPEFNILRPAGVAMLVARLTSPASDMMDRLAQYPEGLGATLDQFANAPLNAVAFACTGSSYLIGREKEATLCKNVEVERGVPLITAAHAVTDWLAAVGARDIGLVSPYPTELTEESVGYWQSAGYHVAEVTAIYKDSGDFHPIYTLGANNAGAGLDSLRNKKLDAIVLLGTGMPTLPAILERAQWDGPPVTSCMLSLGWRASLAVLEEKPNSDNARDWSSGKGWGKRLEFLASA